MSTTDYAGTLLTDTTELLRRVAPSGKTKGPLNLPGSHAFKPRATGDQESLPNPEAAAFMPRRRGSRDNGGLSTKRAAESPQDAYWEYLRSARKPGARTSIGTWGFTVGQAQSLELPPYDDAGIDGLPEHHATVWFPMPPKEHVSDKDLKLMHEQIAEDLLQFALAHGCLYRPNNPEADAAKVGAEQIAQDTTKM